MDYTVMGNNIRVFRKQKMITQETLAEICNITPVFVSQIENGMRKPSLETVCNIAEALEVRVDELIRDNTEKRRSFDDFSDILSERTEDEIEFSYNILKSILDNIEDNYIMIK